MTKVGKGPQSLQDSLKDALKQARARVGLDPAQDEGVRPACFRGGQSRSSQGGQGLLDQADPAFAESAAELDKAAQAKDKDKSRGGPGQPGQFVPGDAIGSTAYGSRGWRSSRRRSPRIWSSRWWSSGGGPPGGFPPPPVVRAVLPPAEFWRSHDQVIRLLEGLNVSAHCRVGQCSEAHHRSQDDTCRSLRSQPLAGSSMKTTWTRILLGCCCDRGRIWSSSSVAADRPAAKPARSGINLDGYDKAVRPQDDFFRHVNGGWIARTRDPGRSPALRLVRSALREERSRPPRDHRGGRRQDRGSAGFRSPQDRRPVRQLHGRGPRRPARPEPDRGRPRADRRDRRQGGLDPRRMASFQREGVAGLFGAFVTTDDKQIGPATSCT